MNPTDFEIRLVQNRRVILALGEQINIEDNMENPTAYQILHFFALAKEIGVKCVFTDLDQRDYWVYVIGKKVNMVYDPNYYRGKDVINGVEIRCRLTNEESDKPKRLLHGLPIACGLSQRNIIEMHNNEESDATNN